jgi:hypothetical protein
MDAASRRSRQKGKAMSRESTHAERIKRAAKRRARKLKAKELLARAASADSILAAERLRERAEEVLDNEVQKGAR